MAFKMKGMSFGKGTGYKSPQAMKKEAAMQMKKEAAMKLKDPMDMKKESPMTKKTQTERAIERLTKKQKRLTKKMREEYVADTDSKKAARLSRRADNVANKLERKKKMAKNIAEGKKGLTERRANTRKTVDRALVKTDKPFNKEGIKASVARTNKISGTTVVKKKSGTGVNKTIKKTVLKPKNIAKPKAPAKPAKPAGPTFNQAFAAARKAGKKTFNWKNPKTGKTGAYHTRTKEEDANYVKKSKGVQGPQPKSGQDYEDKQGKVPFKLKKGAKAEAAVEAVGAKAGRAKVLKAAKKKSAARGAAIGAAMGVAGRKKSKNQTQLK